MNRKFFPLIVLMTIILWAGLIFVTARIYNLAFSAMTVSRFVDTADEKMSLLQPTAVESSDEGKAEYASDTGKQTRLQDDTRSEKAAGDEIGDKKGDLAEKIEDPSKDSKISSSEEIRIPEEMKATEEQVSIPDRIRVLGIVLSRLKPDDIKRFTELGKDGVSDSEKELAKQILKSRVTGKEKDILKEIYDKYSK